MNTAKVGPTLEEASAQAEPIKMPDLDPPLAPAMYGFQWFQHGQWTIDAFGNKPARDRQMEKVRKNGSPVRPFTIPCETADDRKEAP